MPSWEFRCELPPFTASVGFDPAPPPSTEAALFGITWTVYRAYRSVIDPPGVALVAPSGEGYAVTADCIGAPIMNPGIPARSDTVTRTKRLAETTPDEFMHALKAIAERNGE